MMQCFDQLDKISKMERIQFLCNDCGKDFVVDVKLGLHMYAMHTEKPFECAQCGERGSGVAKFKNHMRKHKSQNNVSKCDSCDFETPHAGNLKRHVKLHTAVKPKKSKSIKTCEPCGKTFDRKDSFYCHMKVHLKESAQTFGCTQCDEKFKRKDFLVKHQNTVHTDQVQSEFGFGAFQKEKKLKKKKKFMCDKCAKTFHSEAHIKRHFLTTSHTNRQKKQGSSRWKVMRHVKKLLKDTQYANECEENPKSFINHQQMTKHKKIHENVSCPECNKSFGARRNMMRHMKNVHKARNINETSRNSNGSHTDENLNGDPIDIDNVPFHLT